MQQEKAIVECGIRNADYEIRDPEFATVDTESARGDVNDPESGAITTLSTQ
jgi:hypothetical protein